MIRLDKLLLDRQLVETRQKASALVEEGGVQVNGQIVQKPGKKFSEDAEISLIKEPMPWVSRGALKLIGALDAWNISTDSRTAMDVGSSTGGFTEVLLSRCVQRVIAVDSGTDQLVQKLRDDDRVEVFEKTNFRHFEPVAEIDLVVIDLSFISLTLIWEPLCKHLAPGADIIALVKPQFEVGKENLTRNGIVKNDRARDRALQNVIAEAKKLDYKHCATMPSPITGGDGNHEYLIHLTWQ